MSTAGAVRFPVVFVLGLPRSGTTLLGRMLNAHSQMLCVGEMARLGDAIRKGRPCSCGALLPRCTFWASRLSVLGANDDYDYMRLTTGVYERLRRMTGSGCLIDLSKTRAWRMRCSWRAPWRDATAGYLILHRDGRGLLASWMRGGGGPPLARLLHRYRKWAKRLIRFSQLLPDQTLVLRYEDLCCQTEAVLRALCTFLGTELEAAMLTPGDTEHHFIHSSRSALLPGPIRLDRRWQEELSATDRAAIEACMRHIPGMNRLYPASEVAGSSLPPDPAVPTSRGTQRHPVTLSSRQS